jgi:hypothetical protein
MECYYSSHSLEETKRLVEIAEKLKLIVTAGSDFHGPDLIMHTIGGFPWTKNFDEKRMKVEINSTICK